MAARVSFAGQDFDTGLRYVFGCHFADGSEYFQTHEDVSVDDPNRSAFYDLSQKDGEGNILVGDDQRVIPRDDIELFQLQDGVHTYLVDLRDGHFEVDGVPFFVQHPPKGGRLRLLYFRRRQLHVVKSQATMDPLDSSQECEYHIGWTTDPPGGGMAELILV